MKYAHTNNNGQLLGWYDDEIHNVIPTPNIEVTYEHWKNAINSNHNKVNADGTTCIFDFRTDTEKAAADLSARLRAAHNYLNCSDFKMTVDYFATLSDAERIELTASRADYRAFIHANELT